jgi:hypothetical protein
MKLRPNAPDIQALLEAEQDFPLEEPARQARVLAAVRQAIIALPAGPGSEPGPPADGGTPPTAPAGPTGGTAGSAASLGAAGAGSASLSQLLTVGLVAFVVGGGAGAGVYHLVAGGPPEPPEVAFVAETGGSALDEPVSAEDASLLAEALTGEPDGDTASGHDSEDGVAQDAATRRTPSSPPPDAREATAEERTRERQIIEIARAAVARGNARAALGAVSRHAREFPSGRLSEEREALRILALVSAGRLAEAEQWARTFRRRHPGSIFAPAIARALSRSRRDGG